MELELEFRLQNADSYETDECCVLVDIGDLEIKDTAQNLLNEVDCGELEGFLRSLLSNPMFDGSDVEGGILSKTASTLCERAFEVLGWTDVTATTSSIRIGKNNVDLENDEVQALLTETLALQLVRDDRTMYFYN